MSIDNLPQGRVPPCACWRLARELDAVLDFFNARPKVEFTFENMHRAFVPTSGGLCEIPGALYFDLRRHRVFGESHLPARTTDDHECIRCRALPLDRNRHRAVSSPLSVGGTTALCRDCELELGLNLPPAWPRCDACARPFPTATAGASGFGRWVAPVADDDPLCGACALAARYDDDHGRMIEHCLDAEGQLARGAVSISFQRLQFGVAVLDEATTWLWSGAGLFELLRLGVVSLMEAAEVIRRRGMKICIESPARAPARLRTWAEERHDPNVKLVRATVSNSVISGSGTRAEAYI